MGRFGLWQVELPLLMTAALALVLARRSRLVLPAVVVLGLVLGIFRGAQSVVEYAELERLVGQKVTLVGEVADDATVSDKGHLNFSLHRLTHEGQPISGAVRVRGRYQKVKRGYAVSVTGKLGPTIGSKQAEFGFASQIEVLSTEIGWLEEIRQRFFAGMRTALPEPLASLALGLLVGTRGLIPKSLQDQLTKVGLSHIVAVSGYNLTILTRAAQRPLRQLSKYLSTALVLWLVLGFVVVSGFSASIVRAAVVSVLALLAAYYGRELRPMALIALAAGLTAAVKPDYLWSDLGWQLSFLAFFGIMVLAPAVEQRFVKKPRAIKTLLIESLSAQIMTFPLIAVIFQQLSIASLVSNVIVLPLIPAVMLLGFVAGLGGWLIAPIAGWLAWPAALLLRLILAVVDHLAGLSWSSIQLYISTTDMVLIYGLVAAVLLIMLRAAKQSTLATQTKLVAASPENAPPRQKLN
ncbi:ComEC/Rec2 family competence protein [Candidatus Parcubacteria bacterium]|nr:ComEC/Rec2 family competence protein [Candidatus Parcubacteria bacterium]